ncbi:hypothetical protein FRC07_003415 [Ceratobasidium sp. 392]|nr:hypothetical protein FRC07_003415 [Ceratobasidium sp. 392]
MRSPTPPPTSTQQPGPSWIGGFLASNAESPFVPLSGQADTGVLLSASDRILLPTDPALEPSELYAPNQDSGRSIEYELSAIHERNATSHVYYSAEEHDGAREDTDQDCEEEHEDDENLENEDSNERAATIGEPPTQSRKKTRLREEKVNESTAPWPSLTHFHTHSLFRSPRLGFSQEQQTEILHWAKICGMPNVPTLYSINKCDEKLKLCGDNPTRRFVTRTGDILYMNTPQSGVCQDFSNKSIRELMRLYPSDGEGPKTEFWDGEKLTSGEVADQLTPMAASPSDPGTHYFVNEPCELEGGSLFAPQMFFEREGSLWAHGHEVTCSVKDDVSANRTKQWNKHHVIYSSNAALPRKELNKPRNIRFVGSSPYSKPLEMMRCVRNMCECPGSPRSLEDTVQEVKSQYKVVLESCAVSRLESAQRLKGIKDPVAQPILERMQERGAKVVELSSSTKKQAQLEATSILQKEFENDLAGLPMNPLLGFDVHKDTPLEILHTVLLGAVKYYWRFTYKILESDHKNGTFVPRFNSLSVSGLEMGTSRVPEYICRYPGSLQGQHFRFVVQLAPFALRGLISLELFQVWLLLGRTTVLLWYTEIEDIDTYAVRSVHVRKKPVDFASKTWALALGDVVMCPDTSLDTTLFDSADYIVAQNGNIICPGNDFIYRQAENLNIGRAFKIASSTNRAHNFMIYSPFSWVPELDTECHMPAVTRHDDFEVIVGSVSDLII